MILRFSAPRLLGAFSLTFGLSLPLVASAQVFPTDDAAWLPLKQGDGTLLSDPFGDAATGRDVVGSSASAAVAPAYIYGDGSFVYFRMRIDDPVLQGASAFKPYGWLCLLDTDGNLAKYELAVGVRGNATDMVELWQNTTSANTSDPTDAAETMLKSYPAAGRARQATATTTTNGNADYFVDWAFPQADLVNAGLQVDKPFQLICGTSNNVQSIIYDVIYSPNKTTLTDLASSWIACGPSSCVDACIGYGEPCSVGVGACAATGTKVCQNQMAVCGVLPGEPSPMEFCNGVDDNCDGTVDEGFNLGAPCSVGIGACTNTGTVICNVNDSTTSICDVLPNEPGQLELCNGIDDNCDGTVDEGFDLGASCSAGVGACKNMGTIVCNVNDSSTSICDALAGEPGTEQCNGIDDDCNGTTDEGCGDADGDGLSDELEVLLGTNPMDADSDDDGVMDGAEPAFDQDVDGDNKIGALDPDSDGDGIADGIELGTDCSGAGTDAALCVPDADKGATTTDPTKADTDGGSVPDGVEDSNHNGQIDAGETDPQDPDDDIHVECRADLDCAGQTSGRVCDLATRTCIDGCRGASGNACPDDRICSSETSEIGECLPIPTFSLWGSGVTCGISFAPLGARGFWGLWFGLGLLGLARRRSRRADLAR